MDKAESKSLLTDSLNEMKNVSLFSAPSPFFRNSSLNLSVDSIGLPSTRKRKLDESDKDVEGLRKESRLGSPLMSPWESRRLRADLIEAQSQVVRLEDRIDQLHKKNMEAVILFDQEKAEMKTQLENNRRSIQSLESKLQRMRTREAEAREELIDLKSSQGITKLERDEKILRLESENEELRDRLRERCDSENEELNLLKSELESLKIEIQKVRLNADENEELASSLKSKLAAALEDCRLLEQLKQEVQVANDRAEEYRIERDDLKESSNITTKLHERVLRLGEIEAELKAKNIEIDNLKMAVLNKVYLEERVFDMELKLSAAADRENELISLKERNFDLETEVGKWMTLAEQFCEKGRRDALQVYITELGEKILKNSLERNALLAEVDSALKQVKHISGLLEATKKAESALQESIERQANELRILRRKAALVTRERDSYRQQLDLYEKDLTMSGPCGKVAGLEQSQQERVNQLEKALEEYRLLINNLEKQLKESEKGGVNRIEISKHLEEELKAAKEQLETVSQRKDVLEEMLERRIQAGEFLSPGTKVLHFRNNPFSIAEGKLTEDAAELRRECETLKARVRLLESGEQLDLTVKAAADVNSGQAAKIQDLEEQLESMKLRNTRLKEVFKRTSQEFREVSCMLLGYRLDLRNNVYRLTNIYSEDPTEYLQFQLNKQGAMDMIQTSFTESLTDLINEHLHKNKSIPCFLSALTLYLHGSEGPSSEEDEDDDSDKENDGATGEPEEIEISD